MSASGLPSASVSASARRRRAAGVEVGFGVGAGAGVTTAIGSTVLVVGAAGSFGEAAIFGIVTRTLLDSAPARFCESYARTV